MGHCVSDRQEKLRAYVSDGNDAGRSCILYEDNLQNKDREMIGHGWYFSVPRY